MSNVLLKLVMLHCCYSKNFVFLTDCKILSFFFVRNPLNKLYSECIKYK